MKRFLAAPRRAVPAPVRARARRIVQLRRGLLTDLWQQWADQPIGEPLSRGQLQSTRARYRMLRRVLTIRTRRRHGREYKRRLRVNEAFRLAATAARYYESERLLPDHIMYEAYNGREFACNPFALFSYLLDHPDYLHLRHIIAVDDPDHPKVRRLREHPRVTVVVTHTDEYIRFAETCKYFVNNASFKPYLIKRPDQVYLTTWHSTLLKKLAKDTGRPWEAANVSRAMVASDIHLSPNAYTTELLFKSHGVDGLVRGRVYEMGYPRNDLTINVDRSAVRGRLGVDEPMKVAVYAPTWRGSYEPQDTAAMTMEHASRIRSLLPEDYVLLVKFHSLVYQFVDEANIEGLVPPDVDTNELLGVTDLLITDYSGIFFDYLLTGNPVLFFTPARATYAASKQGFYLDLEALPGPICDDLDALAAAIKRLPEIQVQFAPVYSEFATRFLANDDGKASERAARALLAEEEFGEFLSSAPGATPDPSKRDLFFFPASLAGNGVTESFVALMDKLDHSRFNAVVMLPSATKYQEAQQRLHPEVKVFYQTVIDGYLPDEYAQERVMIDYGATSLDDLPVAAWRRTIRRIFGDFTFDAAINYNGYFPNAAAKIATGVEAHRKLIYLHNDLEVDRTIKHDQLLSVFSLYQLYDRLVCVSADSLADNLSGAARRAQYTFGIDVASRMTYSGNVIVPEEIRARGSAGVIGQVDGEPFLMLRPPGERLVTGIQFDETKKNLVCVGRLSPEKNHARLFRAFRRVVEERDDVALYVVGTGALETQLRSLASALGLTDHITFTGFLSNPLPLVQHCDCFILASDIEGQPITVLEALVLGRPVIATDIAGPRGLLTDGYGVLVPPTDAALTDAILAELSGGAPERRPFDADAYVAKALSQFYSLVDRN